MKRAYSIFCIAFVIALAGGCEKSKSSPAENFGSTPPAAPTSSAATFASGDTLNLSDHDAIADAIRKHLASNSTINMAAMRVGEDALSSSRNVEDRFIAWQARQYDVAIGGKFRNAPRDVSAILN